ncbi:MAG: GIY-YIG nuclease family protein [Ignavibacteriales bacterium]|nr:GIY-YIG nuclease family protein [Ignavibacteriales bacterium]
MSCNTTYILFSHSTNRFYVGHTNNISRRLLEHNSGVNKSTKSGSPWVLVFTREFDSKSEAISLEMKIKKRGISRFLNNQMQPG